jgi:predicted enzyme related to lactoylglutathione lyase
MTQMAVATAHKPIWIDLASQDAAASRTFYAKLFGWQVDVNADPQYGGYARAMVDGQDVAGISPAQSADQPTAWSFYVGTDNAEATAQKVEGAGGKVIAPVFDVGDQGKMAVFQDPVGAFISVWQPTGMGGFQKEGGANAFSWAELNARSRDDALAFYQTVFGWGIKRSDVPDAPPYVEFQVDGESVAGATVLPPEAPAGMPNYWLVYFGVDDVDGAFNKAIGLGATEMVEPQDFPGGRFAIISDPQGAAFGLLKADPRQG